MDLPTFTHWMFDFCSNRLTSLLSHIYVYCAVCAPSKKISGVKFNSLLLTSMVEKIVCTDMFQNRCRYWDIVFFHSISNNASNRVTLRITNWKEWVLNNCRIFRTMKWEHHGTAISSLIKQNLWVRGWCRWIHWF